MSVARVAATRRRDRGRGQALVEFSIVLIPFLLLLMGVVDLGRGIYAYNGASQAAREIARTTSVHPYTPGTCCTLGSSSQARATIATQKGLVPGLVVDAAVDPATGIDCVDITDTVIAASDCKPGDWVRVRVKARFGPLTPLLGWLGPIEFQSTSRIRFQNQEPAP